MVGTRAWTARLNTDTGDEIVIVRVPGRAIANRWLAHAVIATVRSRLPDRPSDIVVMDVTAGRQPTFIGTSADAEAHVGAMASKLSSLDWQFVHIDW